MGYESDIEKGIPIWAAPKAGPQVRFPFKEMQVGDSLVMKMSYLKAKELTRYAGRKYNMQFSIRTIPDKSGVRAWRVK